MPSPVVQVWILDLPSRLGPRTRKKLLPLLDKEERRRYAHMRNDRRKREYLLGHALMHCAENPNIQIPPKRGPFGPISKTKKPSHLRTHAPTDIRTYVSLSHSNRRVACAVAPFPVGIDVEETDRPVDVEKIANRFFSEEEKIALGRLKGRKKVRRFFELWTLKEAFYKGLRRPHPQILREAVFAIRQNQRIKLRMKGGSGWRFRLLSPCEGAVLALAVLPPLHFNNSIKIFCEAAKTRRLISCQSV